MVGRRISVVGTTGAGKTTLARRLTDLLDITHVELDALHWGPDWTPAPREVFRERVREAVVANSLWVVDGNYSRVRDIVWAHADTVVWLDYPLWRILWQLTKRNLRRSLLDVELWNGNRERFRTQFFSRDSLYLWALQTYRRRRQEYPALLAQPEYAHLALIHLRSARETQTWLERLTSAVRQ